MIIEARSSSLPLAFVCAPSLHTVDVKIDHTGEPAGVGTAVHRGLAPLVEGMPPQTALETALEQHQDVDRDEVSSLFWTGVRMWDKLKAERQGTVAEVALKASITSGQIQINLSGHIDMLSVFRAVRRAVVDDWKSGRKDSDYHHQGFGYAALVLLNDPEIDEVQVNFLWLRTFETQTWTVTRERMNDWLNELMDKVGEGANTYCDGPHCGYCHRNHDCKAVTAMVRRDVRMLSDSPGVDVKAMDDPTFATYWRKLKMLEGLVKEAREHAKIEVKRRDGEVPDGNGYVIHFVSRSTGREIDVAKALPTIEKELTKEEYMPALRIVIKDLEDIVAKKAGRGNGASAKRRLNEALEQAGAVTKNTTYSLVDERVK